MSRLPRLPRSSRSLTEILIGPPLETAAAAHQSISKKVGLAVFASDALSSTAYATQEILLILALAGAGAFSLSIPIALAIAVLLLVLTVSYRQTIHAYPSGGGAYIVSRDNLGETAAQVAAAALLTDYILTVAVSISSGVDQIVSAVPALLAWRIELAVVMVLIMAVINLRGVKESGRIFAVPTYIFLGSMALTLIVGFVRWATGELNVLVDAPPLMETAVAPLTAFLVLRAFSSGCTALTGVEAISNGIPAFEEPRSRNAATTLTWMSIILGSIFISITFLAHHIGATPSETETVISQLGRAVWGRGWGQVGLLAATTLILIMAANTSFADFPRLAALAATDGFLPRQLAYRGSRLVFSWGISFLAGMAIFLLIILRANTSRLIPLYAIGVFLSFTLSQSGMVLRWLKVGQLKPGETGHSAHGTTLSADSQWRTKMIVNGIGGLLTAVVMIVFAVTKFRDGAWFVVILIPALVMVFLSIHRHYQRVASQLSLGDVVIAPHASNVKTILLVDDVHAGTLRLVNFALSMGQPWEAVHVAIDPEKTERLKQKWAARIGQGELRILPSPYRSIAGPLRDYLLSLREEDPRLFIHLLLGQLAMPRFWEQLLHRNTNLLLDLVLRDIDRVIVTSIPYQISLRDQYLARLHQESKAGEMTDNN
ncbi:MAG: APC family permease [Ardenticatenaceae bacterium]|nr:APC family permease [Ardenticatenaceae bacterium]